MNNIKKIVDDILELSLKSISVKDWSKVKCKTKNDEELVNNTFKLLKVIQEIDHDDLEDFVLTKEQLSRIADIELSEDKILEICQYLKTSFFKFEYVACDGLSVDYFSYFNEVSYNKDKYYVRLYLSNKILLKGGSDVN